MHSDLVYMNAYVVDQAYGGPEEGGWWYDYGCALASIPVVENDEFGQELAKKILTDMFAWKYEGNRHRHSVIGEPNFEIYIERHPAADYPEETPYYN